jgi:hypothetical protein
MPTIRIDDDVWKALQEHAKPFVDTPNDVLRRVFHLASETSSPASATGGKATMRIGATPQSEYRLPTVQSLRELGGSAIADDVLRKVIKKMEGKLKPVDLELMENGGEPRWRLYARFERKNMVIDGLLKADSAHGWWELTEKGRKYAG